MFTDQLQTGVEVDIQKIIQPEIDMLKKLVKGVPVSPVIKSSAFGAYESRNGLRDGFKWIYLTLCKQGKM